MKLYTNTVSKELLELILSISNNNQFNAFSLCGGTALSLQLGHRLSIDADFVAEQDFDKEELIKNIELQFGNTQNIHQNNIGVFAHINNIKTDFLSWNKKLIKPLIILDNIKLLALEDIAAMKIFAILQRGEKKDYIDIGELLKTFTLAEIINFYKQKYNNGDAVLILRYLTSTSDIENQPMPKMLNNFTWIDYKNIINQQVKNYL